MEGASVLRGPPAVDEEFLVIEAAQSAELLASLASERRRRAEKARARQERLRAAIARLEEEREAVIARQLEEQERDAARQDAERLAAEEARRRKEEEQARRQREEEAALSSSALVPAAKEPVVVLEEQRPSAPAPPPVASSLFSSSKKEEPPPKNEDSNLRSLIVDEARSARSASIAFDRPELKRTVGRTLKKLVGAAINSVQNDRASVAGAAKILKAALTDPAGKKATTRTPFGGSDAPLKREHLASLAAAGVDDHAVSKYVAHLVCERVLERLLDDTFDRKRDVWGLAALVSELCQKPSSSLQFRRILQGYVLEVSPVAVATPPNDDDDDDAKAKDAAERVAAFLAALCCSDDSSDDEESTPFGGVRAAWTWLARYANDLPRRRAPLSSLAPLLAFLDNAAFALAPAFHVHFSTFLATLLAWFRDRLPRAAFVGAAAVRLQDFADTKHPFPVPPGLATFRDSPPA